MLGRVYIKHPLASLYIILFYQIAKSFCRVAWIDEEALEIILTKLYKSVFFKLTYFVYKVSFLDIFCIICPLIMQFI